MCGAITAAAVGVVGSAIVGNQQRKAAEGAANAQKSSIDAASQVERERLQQEQRQYEQQLAEYQRRQAMLEKQQARTQVMLAPYMQAGQGALYEMMALTGMAAPQGAQMPDYTTPQATISGIQGTQPPATVTQPGRMGILSAPVAPLGQQAPEAMSPAAMEFQKGGLSLGSKRWELAKGDSPRKQAADMLAQVTAEMPDATPTEQEREAIRRLNAGYASQQQEQGLDAARAQVPDIPAATSPYAGMTGQQAQQSAIERVSQSPLLQELMGQAETGLLQNAAATGGLRGGRTQAALAQLRPAMLQNEIDKLYSRYQGLSGVGQQSILASPTTAGTNIPTMNYQSQIPNLLTQGGAARAGGILAQGNINADLMRTAIGGIGYGLGQLSGSGTPAYSGLGIGNPSNY